MLGQAARLAGPLLAFGRETDTDFTRLAQGLSRLGAQFARAKLHSTQLEDILRDRDDVHALSSAYTLCKNSIELVHASLGVAQSVQLQMAQVDDSLGRACSARESFDNNFLLLRNLAMGFRVEASRVDAEFQAVFANVAASITEIDAKITASTGQAFARIGELLVGRTDAGQPPRQEHHDQLFFDATESIAVVQKDLEAMRQQLAPCVEGSAQINALLRESDGHTQGILRALQYQDIVRQKLEHVAEGLRDIAASARADSRSGHRRLLVNRRVLHRAARLQQVQLQSARSEMEEAGAAVTGGITQLLEIGEAIATRLFEVERIAAATFDGSRLAELLGGEMRRLARIADTSETSSRRIASLVERIENVVGVFSQDIHRHEREVKLVALNAQVAAARVPSAGALEKLAAETSHIARRNAETTRTLSRDLQDTLAQLQRIKLGADEFLAVITRDRAGLETGASEVGAKLEHHRKSVQERSAAVHEEFAAVRATIQELLDTIRFPDLIAASFDPALALCRDLAAATACAGAEEPLPEEASRHFRAHLHRYTMQEERDAHAAVLGTAAPAAARTPPPPQPAAGPASASSPSATGAPVAATPPPATAPGAGPGDLGDGIELF